MVGFVPPGGGGPPPGGTPTDDSVISATPVPFANDPERIVGADAYTLPSDMPTGATFMPVVEPVGTTVSDELMNPSPLMSNCGVVKLPPVAKLRTIRKELP